jgi:hypothetical protein
MAARSGIASAPNSILNRVAKRFVVIKLDLVGMSGLAT